MSTPLAPRRPAATASQGPKGPAFWIGLIAGWALIAFGIHSATRNVPGLRNADVLWRWLIGGLLVHDGLWVPIVIAAGWVTAVSLPAPVRPPARVGLALSAVIILASLPVTRRYGAIADNPSVDPNNATAGLIVILALIWVAMAGWSALRWRRNGPAIVTSVLRSASGAVHLLDVGSWGEDASDDEESVLAGLRGPALDIGCGPGRLIGLLGSRGVPTLGIDVAPSALQLARERGPVLDRSVFDQLPGEGRWIAVLLFDGNIGIGGDPHTLLRRVASLMAPDGVALVEVGPYGTGVRREAVVLERDGHTSPWFPWAWVGADAVTELAEDAGLVVSRVAQVNSRWFVWLRHRPRS